MIVKTKTANARSSGTKPLSTKAISNLLTKLLREEIVLFEKILVPLDGSEHASHALEKAIQIAKKFDGKITVLHAYTTHLVSLPKEYAAPEAVPRIIDVSLSKEYTSTEAAPRIVDFPYETGLSILEKASDRASAEGIQVETMLTMGNPAEKIVEASLNGKFDLIVIGARGLSPIKEILLGSVSRGVTTQARCPVLVVK